MKKLTTEEFIKRAKKIHGDKYDYSESKYIDTHTNLTIICPQHGPFTQSPCSHLNGAGCHVCAGKKLTKEIFIQRAIELNGDKYDYSQVNYINNKTKVSIICKKHGEFKQTPQHHLLGSQCPKCSDTYHKTNLEWIELAKSIHGEKYDYSQTEYITASKKLTVVCPKHGPFEIYPNNHLHGNGCPKCGMSKLEILISDILKKHNINNVYNKGFEWLKKTKPLYLDFYLPEYDIAIECQGEQHLLEERQFQNRPKNYIIENDRVKKELCDQHNIKLIYFSEVELKDITLNNNLYNNENFFNNRHKLIETII